MTRTLNWEKYQNENNCYNCSSAQSSAFNGERNWDACRFWGVYVKCLLCQLALRLLKLVHPLSALRPESGPEVMLKRLSQMK